MIVLNFADLLQKYAYFLTLMKVLVHVLCISYCNSRNLCDAIPLLSLTFLEYEMKEKKMTGIYQESKKISLQLTLQAVMQTAV